MDNLTGQRLSDQYLLENLIGSGGMADVYKAWDSARSINMAVKVLHSKYSRDRRTLAMFEKEAKILAELGHPNIARLYEFRKHRDYHYLVLEWVDGESLDKIIKVKRQPFSLDEISLVLEPISSALHYLHNNNVLHCDIKPANILIARNKKIYLTDLGVARSKDSGATGGTAFYMAPEQFQSKSISHKTDIYALGITVFELMSGGILPFKGTSTDSIGSTISEKIAWEHINLPIPPLKSLNFNIPEEISNVLEKALAKNPEYRYNSAFEFYNAYETAKETIKNVSADAEKDNSNSARTMLVNHLSERFPNQDQPVPEKNNIPNFQAENLPGRGRKRLIGLEGEWRNKVILLAHSRLTFGRNSQMQVRFNDPRVSRLHATIIKTKKGIFIKDEGSSLGTYVNNRRIKGHVRLRHNDKIRIGQNQVLEFREK